MLQSEVRDVVAQGEQKMIVAVVVRAEEFLGLLDQVLVVIPYLLGSVERGGTIGGDIQFRQRFLSEWNDLQELSGDDRRVDQRGQGNGGELDFVSALAGHGKRRAEFPTVGKLQAGGVVDVVGLESRRIEQYLVPADDGQFVGGGRTGGE